MILGVCEDTVFDEMLLLDDRDVSPADILYRHSINGCGEELLDYVRLLVIYNPQMVHAYLKSMIEQG